MFRWVLLVAAAGAIVVVVTLLSEPVYGVVLGTLFVGLATGWLAAEAGPWRRAAADASAPYRLLVVASDRVPEDALIDELLNRSRGRAVAVRIVAVGDDARSRAATLVAALDAAGLRAEGHADDVDVVAAATRGLGDGVADEIVVGLPSDPEAAVALEVLRREVDVPVTVVRVG
ncbi:MAG: hypothetical protein ACR2NA_13310 [Solirubrobacterales bacterium]